jgi:hypothetical protein
MVTAEGFGKAPCSVFAEEAEDAKAVAQKSDGDTLPEQSDCIFSFTVFDILDIL